MPAAVRRDLGNEFEKGANDLVATMRARAPHKTGALRQTILWRYGSAGADQLAFGATGQKTTGGLAILVTAGGEVNGEKVYYARYVEFGTAPREQGGRFPGTMHPGEPAQPFFFATYRQKRRSLRAGRRRAFKKAVAAGS